MGSVVPAAVVVAVVAAAVGVAVGAAGQPRMPSVVVLSAAAAGSARPVRH